MKRRFVKPGPIETFFEPKLNPYSTALVFSDLSSRGVHFILTSSYSSESSLFLEFLMRGVSGFDLGVKFLDLVSLLGSILISADERIFGTWEGSHISSKLIGLEIGSALEEFCTITLIFGDGDLSEESLL